MDQPATMMPQPVAMEEAPEPSSRGHAEWEQWKKSPTPGHMALALRSVAPTIEGAVRRFPNINAGVVQGEAKRLAIHAIKTFDPQQGASLSTHIFNHLRPLARTTQEMTRAVTVPRKAREDYARYSRVKNDFLEENGRDPHDSELQDILGIPRKRLAKLHQMGAYEFPEGGLEDSPDVGDPEDRRLNLWADYVYHDLNDRDKLLMDMKLGRNGQSVLDSKDVAVKLGIHHTYVNRRAMEIADRILNGVNSHKKDV